MTTFTKLTLATIIGIGGLCAYAQTSNLYECLRCRQQFVGQYPPAYAKCPYTNYQQYHWWSKRR